MLSELAAKGCDAKIASGGGRMGVTMDRWGSGCGGLARLVHPGGCEGGAAGGGQGCAACWGLPPALGSK